ncbi:MAG TPA: PAS domain S-box protein [Syntrophorhabdaceae bacterium]|nr:PAS domain S-box protein [Syntrophorhabdaceae bacterium]
MNNTAFRIPGQGFAVFRFDFPQHLITLELTMTNTTPVAITGEDQHTYRSIFENAVEGMFRTTPEGRLINVNPAYARMFGYCSPEEIIKI